MGLLVKIGADLADFDKKLNKATKEIQYIGKKFEDVGKSMTTKLTLPIMGVVTAATVIGSEFEASMSKVSAITGATGKDFDNLKNKAKELGATTKYSAKESAEAMTFLGMAGYSTNQIIDAMPGLLDLAAASGSDLAVTADIVSDAMTAFGLTADKTGSFADLLANTSRNANTNVEMLGESFKYVAPIAGSLGYSAEDTALALGIMANAGIKASQAGTTLRGAITRLANPTENASRLMKELGLEVTDAEGNMLPFKNVMDQLRSSFAHLTEEQQAQYASTIFGQEAMSGMLAIINATEEDYEKLAEATTNYDGVAKMMAETMQDNLQGQLTKMKSALEGVAIQLSEVLIPIVSNVIEKFAHWVDWFANLDSSTKEMIVKIGLAVAAIGPLLIIIGKAITVVGQLKAGFMLLSAALKLPLAPITAIVAAVVGLIAIFVYLYQTNEDVREKIQAIWENIKEFFQAFVDFAKILWEEFGEYITTFFESLWSFVSDIIEVALDLIKNLFAIFAALFKGDWEGLWNAVGTLFGDLWKGISNVFQKYIDALLNFLKLFGKVFKETWQGIWNVVSNVFKGIWNGISKFFSDIWNGMFNTVKSFINAILKGVNAMINGLNKISFSAPDWVPIIGGKSFGINIPNIPYLDVGTNYVPKDTLAMIHEGEAVVPKKFNPWANGSLGQETTKNITQNLTINSPKHLSPSETARQNRKAMQQLVLGL